MISIRDSPRRNTSCVPDLKSGAAESLSCLSPYANESPSMGMAHVYSKKSTKPSKIQILQASASAREDATKLRLASEIPLDECIIRVPI